MQAIRIYTHSIRQVSRNLGPALRITLAPMLLQDVAISVAEHFTQPAGTVKDLAQSPLPIAILAALLALTIFCSSWMAVAWHRFVLMAELPGGILPPVHGERMVAYIGRSLLLGLSLVAVEFSGAVMLMLFSGMLGAVSRALALLVLVPGGIALLVVLFTIFYRLSVMLPAAALGADASLKTAWEATEGASVTLFTLAALVVGTVIVLVLPQAIFYRAGLMVFAIVWQVVSGWAVMLLMLSALTTVYGYYVQKRTLV